MRKLIIGSSAIKHHFLNFKRDPKDVDYAVDTKDIDKKCLETKIDSKHIEYLYNPIIFKYTDPNQVYATPSQILTLKMSHISWNINFKKHMFDIQFLKDNNVEYIPELYEELYQFWLEIKGRKGKYRRSDLTLNSSNFFDNNIEEMVGTNHDKLHTLLTDTPAYIQILRDGCEVEPDENKFNAISLEQQLKVVEEEVMVMAYERFRDKQYKVGYEMMLELFVTGHAPIWQLLFIIKHYKTLRKPSFNYYKKIEAQIEKIKN